LRNLEDPVKITAER